MVLKSDDAQGRAPRPAPAPRGGAMKVRMRHQMSGTRDGVDWPSPGETVDLPGEEAAALCAQGMAEPAEDEAEPETATAPKATTRKKAR